jgi:hypothetical protein
MNEKLDELLCQRYPKMMVNRNKTAQETCMCWGFSCGDGWYNILNQLMSNIQHHIDWKQEQKEKYNRGEGCTQVTLDQVKEKFGTLRFYYTGGDDEIRGMVRMAESMSGVICEECGSPGTQTQGGWIKTACDSHRGKVNER